MTSIKNSSDRKFNSKKIKLRRNAIKNLVDIKACSKIIQNKHSTRKMTKTLALASFSFVILNLPYVIMW